ncbi:MAG: high-potential iron-sulfur protein [Chromatiales bacterium]|nr:high-potential iron-sulfur protein [Chromatiales bacterium]
MKEFPLTRRQFIRSAALAGAAGPLLLNGQARAEDLPRLSEDDPAARALLYVHDVADLDLNNPMAARFEPGQDCSNCVFIEGDPAADWRPCTYFPGKLVSNRGWCAIWAPQG